MSAPKLPVGVFLIALFTFEELSSVWMILDDVRLQTARIYRFPVAVRTIVVLHCFGVRMCLGNVGPHINHPIELFVAKRTSVNGGDCLNIVYMVISGSKQRLIFIVIIGFLLLDFDPGGYSKLLAAYLLWLRSCVPGGTHVRIKILEVCDSIMMKKIGVGASIGQSPGFTCSRSTDILF